MAKQKHCAMPDASRFDKPVRFLRAPDELSPGWNEASVREWREWRGKGGAYAAVHTSGSRQFYAASQQHQAIDAVIECPWSSVTAAITTTDAIKLTNGPTPTYYLVIAADNVDESNQLMRFVCRKSTSDQSMED